MKKINSVETKTYRIKGIERLILLILCIAIVGFFAMSWISKASDSRMYKSIEALLPLIDELESLGNFEHAKMDGSELKLRFEDGSVKSMVLAEKYLPAMKRIIYIFADEYAVYLVTGGAVDDVWGFMFPKVTNIVNLKYLSRVERVLDSGIPNLYYFSTM